MGEKLRFLGLDVHAETIAVAVAEPDGEVRSLGTITNRDDSIRKLIKKLGPVEQLRACYEAGPTGFVLYWQLTQLGVECAVVAPTLVPKKAGDRVKTDRRDALKLARSHRSDDLTAVWVPDEGSEALRDLVRAREAAKQDQLRAWHRLTKFLLRTGQRPPLGPKAWTEKYVEWIQQVHYTHPARETTLLDCLNEVQHMEPRVKRLEQSILEVVSLAPAPVQAVIQGLQALRGVAHISAVTIAAELGNASEFAICNPVQGDLHLVFTRRQREILSGSGRSETRSGTSEIYQSAPNCALKLPRCLLSYPMRKDVKTKILPAPLFKLNVSHIFRWTQGVLIF